MDQLDYGEVVARLDALIGPMDDDAKGRKRRAILGAATDLFIRQGYRKTSIDEVARAAGVAKGTVYLYFETKIDLLIAAIAKEKRGYLERMRALFEDDLPAKERVRRWLELGLVAVMQMPLILRLMSGDQEMAAVMRDMPPELREQSDHDRQRFFGSLLQEISPGRLTPAQLDERVGVLAGIFHFAPLITQEHVRSGISVDRFARVLSELVTDGLTHSPGTEP